MGFLKTRQVSELLGVSIQTLQRWAKNKNGPIIPIQYTKHSPYLWKIEDIERFISRGEIDKYIIKLLKGEEEKSQIDDYLDSIYGE